MSHYDADYEAEEEERQKGYKQLLRRALKDVKLFETSGALSLVPSRFRDSITDMTNHLKAQLNEPS